MEGDATGDLYTTPFFLNVTLMLLLKKAGKGFSIHLKFPSSSLYIKKRKLPRYIDISKLFKFLQAPHILYILSERLRVMLVTGDNMG